jgi:hypothetical protein
MSACPYKVYEYANFYLVGHWFKRIYFWIAANNRKTLTSLCMPTLSWCCEVTDSCKLPLYAEHTGHVVGSVIYCTEREKEIKRM